MKFCRCLIAGTLLTVLPASDAIRAEANLDSSAAAAGLKEALRVGTVRAVDLLGQVDGYLANPEAHIPVPRKLEKIGKALTTLGLDEVVEQFETSMNRAAEAAAPLAKEVFVGAIKEMSFTDALVIVRGKEHEATDYLKEHARPILTERFRPIISEQLDAVDATRAFDTLMGRTAELPFVSKPALDLEAYVTRKALDGMFLMIAREEERIRDDPVARTSELLKTVFGAGDEQADKKPWWKRLFR